MSAPSVSIQQQQPLPPVTATPSGTSSDAVLLEHFGFHPMDFIDDVINVLNDVSYQGLSALEEFVRSELGDSDEVEQGMAKTESLINAALDQISDMLEMLCLKHIFTVPQGLPIRLKHYEGLELNVTEEDEAALDKEIEQLRSKVKATKMMNKVMESQSVACDHILPKLRVIKEKIQGLQSIPQEHNVTSVVERLQFLTTQITQLKTLIRTTQTNTETVSIKDLVTKASKRVAQIHSIVAAHIDARKKKTEERRKSLAATGGLVGSGMVLDAEGNMPAATDMVIDDEYEVAMKIASPETMQQCLNEWGM